MGWAKDWVAKNKDNVRVRLVPPEEYGTLVIIGAHPPGPPRKPVDGADPEGVGQHQARRRGRQGRKNRPQRAGSEASVNDPDEVQAEGAGEGVRR